MGRLYPPRVGEAVHQEEPTPARLLDRPSRLGKRARDGVVDLDPDRLAYIDDQRDLGARAELDRVGDELADQQDRGLGDLRRSRW